MQQTGIFYADIGKRRGFDGLPRISGNPCGACNQSPSGPCRVKVRDAGAYVLSDRAGMEVDRVKRVDLEVQDED